ncbi:M3 family metallopeptidase, partial [uncultured Akkermansia sp.]
RVMEKARREECRKDLWEHHQSLATGACDTEPVIREILSLRCEKAHLCGYKAYPDYALRESMAGNGEHAMKFVNELLDKIRPSFFREMETLRRLKARRTGQEKARLNPWDVAYYANLQAEERFRLDQEELRRYFPLPRVLDGLFSLAERLYGIRVAEVPARQALSGIPADKSAGAVEVWHPDVRFFTIDDGNGNRLGSFYLDLFSRNNKRAGAWMNTLDTGSPSTPETPGKPRLGMVCLNIHPPAAGHAVTLTHREVRTLFHEFGHLLHLMFTRVAISSLAGTSVPRDFVEVPSQFMENWCWRPDVLKSFARHEQTGLPIPEEMLRSLDASRGNTPALALAGQLLYAKMDLAVHAEPERFSSGSLDDVDSAVAGDMDYFKNFKRAGKLRTARHLFSSPSGYASFYFSYQWAEVLDKDIFEAFERAGGPDRETAGKFRETILEKGYAVPPMRQFMDFMGRKPRMDAMLRKRRLAS